jgi:trigger factor
VKVSVEKLPTSEAVLEVDVTWDELEKASEKAYRKLVQKVDIQGFRRGKAPRSILERKLGKEYIYQEGLDDLISEAYRNTLKEHDLTPISQPKLDAPTFEMGQSYHFSLTVPILMPVELGDYRSLHFEREEVGVTSEEVDKELEKLYNRLAIWNVVERPATYGDRITVDLTLTSADQVISNLKDNTFELTQERSALFTGMDEQVVGMQSGESKSFSTTIPTDYSNEKLAGKQADYELVLHKVEEKQFPELDDAFASKVSDGQFSTMEDLSKFISDNILEQKKRQVRDNLREKILSAVIEQSTFTIHPTLINEQAERTLHQLEHMLEAQHISLDQYFMMTRKSRSEYLAEIQPQAEKEIQRQLVLEAIAHKEDIKVTTEEIEGLFSLYAQAGQSLPRTEEQIRTLASGYRREKTLIRLTELTTDPESDVVDISAEAALTSSQAEENAAAAARAASETALVDTHNDDEASATATPLPGDRNTETVE